MIIKFSGKVCWKRQTTFRIATLYSCMVTFVKHHADKSKIQLVSMSYKTNMPICQKTFSDHRICI